MSLGEPRSPCDPQDVPAQAAGPQPESRKDTEHPAGGRPQAPPAGQQAIGSRRHSDAQQGLSLCCLHGGTPWETLNPMSRRRPLRQDVDTSPGVWKEPRVFTHLGLPRNRFGGVGLGLSPHHCAARRGRPEHGQGRPAMRQLAADGGRFAAIPRTPMWTCKPVPGSGGCTSQPCFHLPGRDLQPRGPGVHSRRPVWEDKEPEPPLLLYSQSTGLFLLPRAGSLFPPQQVPGASPRRALLLLRRGRPLVGTPRLPGASGQDGEMRDGWTRFQGSGQDWDRWTPVCSHCRRTPDLRGPGGPS